MRPSWSRSSAQGMELVKSWPGQHCRYLAQRVSENPKTLCPTQTEVWGHRGVTTDPQKEHEGAPALSASPAPVS